MLRESLSTREGAVASFRPRAYPDSWRPMRQSRSGVVFPSYPPGDQDGSSAEPPVNCICIEVNVPEQMFTCCGAGRRDFGKVEGGAMGSLRGWVLGRVVSDSRVKPQGPKSESSRSRSSSAQIHSHTRDRSFPARRELGRGRVKREGTRAYNRHKARQALINLSLVPPGKCSVG